MEHGSNHFIVEMYTGIKLKHTTHARTHTRNCVEHTHIYIYINRHRIYVYVTCNISRAANTELDPQQAGRHSLFNGFNRLENYWNSKVYIVYKVWSILKVLNTDDLESAGFPCSAPSGAVWCTKPVGIPQFRRERSLVMQPTSTGSIFMKWGAM